MSLTLLARFELQVQMVEVMGVSTERVYNQIMSEGLGFSYTCQLGKAFAYYGSSFELYHNT